MPRGTRIRRNPLESAWIGIGILSRSAPQKLCKASVFGQRFQRARKSSCESRPLWSRMQAMRNRFVPAILCAMLLSVGAPLAAQDIDTVVTTPNRNPSTVADQIADPAEKAAFLRLYNHRDPAEMLQAAKLFLQDFPQSAFLAQAYEVAADSSFDQHQYAAGLEYAKKSLTYLPENPQLLVAVADVQAREHLNDKAIASAQAALDYFERFVRAGAVAESQWPATKRRLQASGNFPFGRALLQEEGDGP